MKNIIFSFFLLLLTSLSLSSQITQDSTERKKISITNTELGVNVFLGNLGVYLEPKYVDDDLNEFGLQFAYHHQEEINFGGPVSQRDSDLMSILTTIKKRSNGPNLGFYFGFGGGILAGIVGGDTDPRTEDFFVVSPAFLVDFGVYVGVLNFGFRAVVGSTKINGLGGFNLALRI